MSVTNLIQDLRYAARLLMKDRSFTITALLTLAICIGANAAIFSIVRSVVMKPLPVPNAERIVMFHNNYPKAGAVRGSTGVPDYFDRKEAMDVTEDMALYRRQGSTLGGRDGARRLATIRATPSLYRIVSMQPTLGRIFREDEGEDGKNNEVILSHALWQREFGGANDVVGKELKLSGVTFQIVGVAPQDFRFIWNDIDAYLPAAFTPTDKSDERRHSNNWQMIAMLKPGKTVAQAKEQVDTINRRNEDRFPQLTKLLHDAGFHTTVLALAFAAMALFLSAVGIYGVLAYGVAQRRREIGIRLALGSTSREVFNLVLQDGIKIVAMGLVLGFAGLIALRQALTSVLFGVTPMDPMVIASVALALTVVALLAMVIPARRAASVSPAVALTD